LWSTKSNTPVLPAQSSLATEEALVSTPEATDPVVSQMATMGVSDDIASIEADLKATNLNNISSSPQVN
jgi:hypothetical protein